MDSSLPSSFQLCLHTISSPCFASDPMSSRRWLGGASEFLFFDLYGRVRGKELLGNKTPNSMKSLLIVDHGIGVELEGLEGPQ